MEFSEKNVVAGIVCEYNPFHAGHAWMVEELRNNGAEIIVCVMSGPFVQRAEAACLPTYLRARAAVLGGVDLVFRLPTPWAAASAEAFGYASVGLLCALGCVNKVAFGAETADTDRLREVAAMLETPAFQQALKNELQKGGGFASARAAAAEVALSGAGEVLCSPNNILAVEYCKALRRGYPQLEKTGDLMLPCPQALPRKGAGHDGAPEDGIASASWLRRRATAGGADLLARYVPPKCLQLYQKAEREGFWLEADRYEMLMLSRLRGCTAERLAGYAAAGEGLQNRFAVAARQAVTLDGLYALAKTKRFAHSRVRRLAVSAMLDIPQNLSPVPPFLHLLAASGKGLAFLKQAKQTARLPLSTSLAKLAQSGEEAKRVVVLEAKAEDLHAFCLQQPQPGGGAFTHPVQIVP